MYLSNKVNYRENKGFRLLSIYERLNKGEVISKEQLSNQFGVTNKTIQRDIDDLRAYLAETNFEENEVTIKYDKSKKGYYLVKFKREWLTNEEVLSLCKILLESRAFCKEELDTLIRKLLGQTVVVDRKKVSDIIRNEQFNYVPRQHNKRLLTKIWDISQYIISKEIIKFEYTRQDKVKKERVVKPVAIMFSEYYFYLVAYMVNSDKEFPTIFRIDRIEKLNETKEKFHIPYKDKFNDGEFRKRIQFMYAGELKKLTFKFSGSSLEAILDRLPTVEVISVNDGVYTITAESYGNGIDMWLRSQGDNVKIL